MLPRHHARGSSLVVWEIWVRIESVKDTGEVFVVQMNRPMERRPAVVVDAVGIGTGIEEHHEGLLLVEHDSNMKWGLPCGITLFNIDAFVK